MAIKKLKLRVTILTASATTDLQIVIWFVHCDIVADINVNAALKVLLVQTKKH